jgi:hypothetical protein
VLAGASWSVHAKEAYVLYLSVDKVSLKIVKGLCSVKTGLTIVVGELGDEAKV